MPARQLILDLAVRPPARFDNFVAGANGELLARLRALALPGAREAIYVWGEAGSGRTHLLQAAEAQACASARPVAFVRGAEAGDELDAATGGLLIVDDVQHLNDAAQIALFRAFNTMPLAGSALLMSGDAPPLGLKLREDLRTRIGSALVFEVKPLTDADKAATLRAHAQQRAIPLGDELIDYLLRHAPRDLPTLLAVLNRLDAASLEQKRALTLPLLKEVLQALQAQGFRGRS